MRSFLSHGARSVSAAGGHVPPTRGDDECGAVRHDAAADRSPMITASVRMSRGVLFVAAMLIPLLAGSVSFAQTLEPAEWEGLGLLPYNPKTIVYDVVFMPQEGAEEDTSLDDILLFGLDGVFRYAPGQDNGEWGNWHRLCGSFACSPRSGIRTDQGSLIAAHLFRVIRSTDRGLTWDENVYTGADDLLQATLPGIEGVIFGASDRIGRSDGDGARNTWRYGGQTGGNPAEAIAEVPPSARLPRGASPDRRLERRHLLRRRRRDVDSVVGVPAGRLHRAVRSRSSRVRAIPTAGRSSPASATRSTTRTHTGRCSAPKTAERRGRSSTASTRRRGGCTA